VPGWLIRRARRRAVLPPQTAYGLWASTYPPHAHNALMRAEQAAVEALLPDLAGLDALDAGCGTGRYLRLLRARGARRVVGVDLSRPMLAPARALCPWLVQGDLGALPLQSASFDAAVCGLALNDVGALGGTVGELARILRPGGRLVYSVVHPSGAAQGWTRTFETPAGRHEIASHWHPWPAHEQACAAAGLRVDEVREPELDVPGAATGPVALVVLTSRGA
jgi:malonyl-CoA O-methyltransferase